RSLEAAAGTAPAYGPAGGAGSAARPRAITGGRPAAESGPHAGPGPGTAFAARLYTVRNSDGAGTARPAAGDPAAGARRTAAAGTVPAARAKPRAPDAADSPGPVGPAAAGAEPVE